MQPTQVGPPLTPVTTTPMTTPPTPRAMQPTQIGPPLAPVTTTPPYQPESDVDRFLRHAHALGIQHHQGDGALVATGMRICDAVRKGAPIPSVVLGFTEVFVVQGGVNQKDADAFAW